MESQNQFKMNSSDDYSGATIEMDASTSTEMSTSTSIEVDASVSIEMDDSMCGSKTQPFETMTADDIVNFMNQFIKDVKIFIDPIIEVSYFFVYRKQKFKQREFMYCLTPFQAGGVYNIAFIYRCRQQQHEFC